MTELEWKEQLSNLDLEEVVGVFILDTKESYQYNGYTVNFGESFYQGHKEEIDQFVKKLCTYQRKWLKHLFFMSYPLTLEHFHLLKENESIQEITLEGHELTKEEFKILSQNRGLKEINSSSVCEELRECYDKRLGAVMKKYVTSYKMVGDILYDENLNFYENLTEEQVQTICSLLEKRKLKGHLRFCDMNNGFLIKRIIDQFEKINSEEKDSKVSIEISHRESFDYKAFDNWKQNARIEVITNTDEIVDMNTFIQVEKKLVEITKEYKEQEDKLSPLERLMWIYSIVETYRKYEKESREEDWKQSRFLHYVLFSEYLVCAGFSLLLAELSQRASLNVWGNFSIMHCENKRDIRRNDYNHMNNLIFLEDEKYDIKGLYLLDATHDNHNYEDFFVLNHFLVTPDRYDTHIMKMYAAGYSLLTMKEKDPFIETLKNDEFSLSSLISILSLYYKDYDLFGVSFDDEEGRLSYYSERAETLYELAQNITIEQVSQEKLEKALIHIEKIKNPSITIEELTEKVDKTFEVYQERNDRIYGYRKVKTNK